MTLEDSGVVPMNLLIIRTSLDGSICENHPSASIDALARILDLPQPATPCITRGQPEDLKKTVT